MENLGAINLQLQTFRLWRLLLRHLATGWAGLSSPALRVGPVWSTLGLVCTVQASCVSQSCPPSPPNDGRTSRPTGPDRRCPPTDRGRLLPGSAGHSAANR